jgi:hypothetical protein
VTARRRNYSCGGTDGPAIDAPFCGRVPDDVEAFLSGRLRLRRRWRRPRIEHAMGYLFILAVNIAVIVGIVFMEWPSKTTVGT